MDSAEALLKTLMIAGLAGDATAYRRLLEAAAHRLKPFFAIRVGADYADLEDLVQETLVAIHNKRASYDPALPFTSWLLAIARYKLIDHLRKRGIRTHVPLEEAGMVAARDEHEASIASADIEELLGKLPDKHREAIRLTRIEGHSAREAAVLTGQSPASIKVNVHRGLRRLMARVRGGYDND